jgi:hypothetical protein
MGGGVQIAMRTIYGAAISLLCLISPAQAAEPQACNVMADVIDNDPKGTNVRATPGGKVIDILKVSSDPSADDWIEVHIVGQSGDWLLIDRADRVGDDRKTIFHGRGDVHRSALGASGLQANSQLWTDHHVTSPLIAEHPLGDQAVQFLGCWGEFAKVHIKEGTGWTRSLCLNQRTTCS